MRKMTITEGLAELKLLDARINKVTHQDAWCIAEANEKATNERKERVSKELSARWDSVKALINERSKIKSAIVKSNALTTILIGDREMTVAEAIDMKSAIDYEKALVDRLYADLSTATERAEALNARVQGKIDAAIQALAASGSKDITEAQSVIHDNYMQKNGYQVIDPIDCKASADALKAWTDTFLKNVDVALSVSNATTIIEI